MPPDGFAAGSFEPAIVTPGQLEANGVVPDAVVAVSREPGAPNETLSGSNGHHTELSNVSSLLVAPRPYSRLVRGPDGIKKRILTIQLTPRHICDLDCTMAFRRPRKDDDDDEDENANEKTRKKELCWVYEPLLPGLGKLVEVFTVANPRPEQVTYHIKYKGRSVVVTFKEFADGTSIKHFPGATLTERRRFQLWADLIKAQVDAFDVPITELPGHGGWNEIELPGRDGSSEIETHWVWVYENGQFLTADGLSAGTSGNVCVIAGQRMSKKLRRRFARLSELVSKPLSRDNLAQLIALCAEIDPGERLLTDTFLAVRASVSQFSRIACGQVKEGPGGCGKTTSAKLQRCVAGPYSLDMPVDASFQDTATSIELKIGHIADRSLAIDEFRPDRDPREVKALDKITASATEGIPVRGRSTKELTPGNDVIVSGLPIILANSMAGVDETRQRRFVHQVYRSDELDLKLFREGFDTLSKLLARLGYAVNHRVALELKAHGEGTVADMIDGFDQAGTDALHAAMKDVKSVDDHKWSLAANWARCLSGLRLVEWALPEAAVGLGRFVEPAVESAALAHLRLLGTGGASGATSEMLAEIVRDAFRRREMHLLDADELPLPPAPDLARWGYARGGGTGPEWQAQGQYGGNLKDDVAYFMSGPLADAVRGGFERRGLPYPWNSKTFPRAMAGIGFVDPDTDQTAQRPYIKGKPQRRLAVPVDRIFCGDIDDVAEYSVIQSCRPSTPQKPSHFHMTECSEPIAPENIQSCAFDQENQLDRQRHDCMTEYSATSFRNSVETLLRLGEFLAWPMVPAPASDDGLLVDAGESPWRDLASRGARGDIRAVLLAIAGGEADRTEFNDLSASAPSATAEPSEPRPAAPEAATEAKAANPVTDGLNGKGHSTVTGEALAAIPDGKPQSADANGDANTDTGLSRYPALRDRIPHARGAPASYSASRNKPALVREAVSAQRGNGPAEKIHPASRDETAHARPPQIALVIGDTHVVRVDYRAGVIEKLPHSDATYPSVADIGYLAHAALSDQQPQAYQTWVTNQHLDVAGVEPERPDVEGWDVWDGAPDRFGGGELPPDYYRKDNAPGIIKPAVEIRGPDGLTATTIFTPGLREPIPNLARFEDANSPEEMAGSLLAYRVTTGFSPTLQPAFAIMTRRLNRNRVDLKATMPPAEFAPPALAATVNTFAFGRPFEPDERSGKHLPILDVNGEFLSALNRRYVPFGRSQELDAAAARKALAKMIETKGRECLGYYRARLSCEGIAGELLTNAREIDADGFSWFTPAELLLAAELHLPSEISAAWVYPRSELPYQPVYERLRDARRDLMLSGVVDCDRALAERLFSGRTDTEGVTLMARVKASIPRSHELALNEIKALYPGFIGGLASNERYRRNELNDFFRPDHRHFIIGAARAAIIRQLVSAGIKPVAIKNDAVHLITDGPELPTDLLPISFCLGHYKPVIPSGIPVEELPRSVLRGKAALTAPEALKLWQKIHGAK